MIEGDKRALWGAAVVAASLVGGGGDPDPPADRVSPTQTGDEPARSAPDPSFELATFSSPLVKRDLKLTVSAALDALLDRHTFTGALYLSLPNGSEISVARGEALTGSPIVPESVFPIASISKTLTALTVLRLIDSGALSIDTTLSELIPLFERAGIEVPERVSHISIRHLLNHTSGLSGNIPYGVDPSDRAAMLTAMLAEDLRFAPGQRFAYSNRGYVVLAGVVELLTEEPFEEAVARLVLRPLGVSAISPYGDSEISGSSVVLGDSSGESMLSEPLSWGRKGCTGFVSSASDLARVFTAVVDPQFLSSDAQRMLIECPEWAYGGGVVVSELPSGELAIAHGGAERGGVSTFAIATTESPRAGVVFSAGEEIASIIKRSITLGLLGEELSPSPEAELRRFEGEYVGPDGESFRASIITTAEGDLALRVSSISPATSFHLNFGSAMSERARLCERIADEIRELVNTANLASVCSPYAAEKLRSLGLNGDSPERWRVAGANQTPDRLAIECRLISEEGEHISLILQRPAFGGDYRIEAVGSSGHIFRREAPELATSFAVRDLFLTASGKLYAFNGATECPEVVLEPDLSGESGASVTHLTLRAGSFVEPYTRRQFHPEQLSRADLPVE